MTDKYMMLIKEEVQELIEKSKQCSENIELSMVASCTQVMPNVDKSKEGSLVIKAEVTSSDDFWIQAYWRDKIIRYLTVDNASTYIGDEEIPCTKSSQELLEEFIDKLSKEHTIIGIKGISVESSSHRDLSHLNLNEI